MYPEDRVLVGVMPHVEDLEIAHKQHWYRIPRRSMSQGVHAEYIAFYFTKAFGPDLRWAIHFYARRTGHELVRRIDLLPGETDHPRANKRYYKIQLGPIRQKRPPIISLRWRRITFIQTTWDRFVVAREINDLFKTDAQFVERVYHALKQRGIQPEREVSVKEGRNKYTIDMLIPCRDGAVMLSSNEKRPSTALLIGGNEEEELETIEKAIEAQGGPQKLDTNREY